MVRSQSLSKVDEEYNKALHTNSFIAIWKKGHHHLNRTTSQDEPQTTSPFSLVLLDPIQETLVAATLSNNNTYTTLLHEYFNTTLEASRACTSLLASIHRSRTHHYTLCRFLLREHDTCHRDLASYVQRDNPFSPSNLTHFHYTHALYGPLVGRLTNAHHRIMRRAWIARLTGCVKMSRGVEAAAKGVYIVGRELDTVSRMVARLHGEVEHERAVVRMIVGSRGTGEILRQVVRCVESGEGGFGELVDELEEHVYLCLLTINRSRRMVAQEIIDGGS